MSMFPAESAPDAVDLDARRNAHLPSPTKTRFKPLRAGVLNVWEYDDQQFWFGDGRLLLRGRNEAGKSKVLELLFPFVLDGDTSPKKLDPFDTANKSMWWNMVGFSTDKRKSVIGYLWLEFGRIADDGHPEYLTSVVGVQATAAEKKCVTWFAVTPQRIGAELDLAPGGTPLTQDAFNGALSIDAKPETKATAHRANIASRLFFMSPERYDNLLHLLRQLRKPKLADKLDPKKLSAVLTDALPPLDEHRIKPLADGFGFLDADIEQLAGTETALRATSAFLDVYRGYAQAHVRQRADTVRGAITRFDAVTRDAADAKIKLSDAREKSKRLADESTRLDREYAEATGSLAGLDLSAVESLRTLEQTWKSDQALTEARRDEAKRTKCSATEAGGTAARRDQEEADARADADAAVATARAASDRAGLGGDWETSDHSASANRLTDAAGEQRILVDTVDTTDRRATEARRKLDAAEVRRTDAAQAVSEVADDLEAAKTAEAAAEAAFIGAVDTWCSQSPAENPPVDGGDIADELAEAVAAGNATTRTVIATATGPAVTTARQAVAKAGLAEAEARGLHRDAGDALAVHDALPADPPPPLRPGIAAHRDGTPLWLAVDFAPQVTPVEAAMVEAALEAAGLLDAVISPKGLEILDGDDTVLLAPKSDAAGLAAWLTTAPGADEKLTARAIAAIGAGADSGLDCWIDLNGQWANGVLTGRWTKPTAEYIGAGARAAAKARRRTELAAKVDEAAQQLAVTTAAVEAASAHREAVDTWAAAFPTLAGWTSAAHDLRTASRDADRAAAKQRKASADYATEHAKVEAVLDAVTAAIEAAGCQPADVPTRREQLDTATQRARDLSTAGRDLVRAERNAADARGLADKLAAEAAEAEARHESARLEATESKAAYDTAVELQGADVEKILATKQRLEQSVADLKAQRGTVSDEKEAARDAEIRAEGVLEVTEQRRGEATETRDEAFASLAALVRTGHVTLALGIDAGRDPSEYLHPTAARNLARQIATAIDEDQGTPEARDAADNRLTREYTKLRDDVGADFDPHLDSVAEIRAASATLNGEVITIAELHQALVEDVAERRAAIHAEERTLIEQHLRDEVGNHLGDRLHDAKSQIRQMNTTLGAHPTNSGATVQLQWRVDDEAGPNVSVAVDALLTSPATRTEHASALLATFLGERVALARRGDVEGADLAERLTAALDYRTWYRFKLTYKTDAGEGALTSKTVGTGSGGQQAKISHLPLLAAAAGFYSSSPTAPRLCFLDEAFAGIDGPNTTDLLAVSVSLDLDMVMTNYDAWFCIPELPGLAIYHLEKLRGTVGVAAIRYLWDGTDQTTDDPWLNE
jgi:uncharacterized protein (TIGR02680 family)